MRDIELGMARGQQLAQFLRYGFIAGNGDQPDIQANCPFRTARTREPGRSNGLLAHHAPSPAASSGRNSDGGKQIPLILQ
jgi:hypothetical protein